MEKQNKKARFSFVHARKKGDESVELRVYFGDGVVKYIATKIKVPRSAWNSEWQTVLKQYPNSEKINDYLARFKSDYEAVELDCMADGVRFTPEVLDRAREKMSRGGRFIDYCRAQICVEIQRQKYADGTIKHLQTFCNVLERFEQDTATEITFSSADKDLLVQLDIYYKRAYTSYETVRKQFVWFKKYWRMAMADGLARRNPFDGFKLEKNKEQKQVRRDALSAFELHKLEEMADDGWLDETTQLVLDRFLLSCYTGLRISDNADLRRKDITYDDDGHLVIDRITIKTKTRVVLPLHYLFAGKGEKIIEKYKDRNAFSDFVFPKLSDQKTNDKLKLIAAAAQIRNLGLSFHIARHTCATMLAEKTGNPYTIMQLLGHSDIKISMTYIHNSYATVVNSLIGVKW